MVKKLKIKESAPIKKYSIRKTVKESANKLTIDEMQKRLDEFGFDAADGYEYGKYDEGETLFDYFMQDGFYATANLENMKGYFTWTSPNGNGYDVLGDSLEFDFNTPNGFEDFLGTVYQNDNYDDSELIDALCLKALGFSEPTNWVYEYEFSGSDGSYVARWSNKYPWGGIIEGEETDGAYAREFDDFIEFIEEINYLSATQW